MPTTNSKPPRAAATALALLSLTALVSPTAAASFDGNYLSTGQAGAQTQVNTARTFWPGLHIEHQHAFINHRTMMGLGCAAGHYLALAASLRYLRTRNERCNYHLMFEDEALPFAGTGSEPTTLTVNPREIRKSLKDLLFKATTATARVLLATTTAGSRLE